VLFPDGEDPDSYARRVSSTELNFFLTENAKDFIAFKTDMLLAETANDPAKRAALVHEIVHSIALIPDMITRQVYLQECSRLMGITEETLISEMNKERRDNFSKKAKEEARKQRSEQRNALQPPPSYLPPDLPPDYLDNMPPNTMPPDMMGPPPGMQEGEAWEGVVRQEVPAQSSTDNKIEFQEKDLIRILLNYGDQFIPIQFETEGGETKDVELPISYYIALELERDGILLANENYQKILDLYVAKVRSEENNLPSLDYFLQHEDPKVSNIAVDVITSQHSLSENWQLKHFIYTTTEDMRLAESVRSVVFSLKLAKVEAMITTIQQQLKTGTTSDTEINDLLAEQTVLMEAKKLLSAELGRVIVR